MGSINPQTITLRLPSKYSTSSSPESSSSSSSSFTSPPLEWLYRTWSVTHSTLSMWRSARNVRITYKPLPSSSSSSDGGPTRIDDLVEYESSSSPKGGAAKGTVKSVAGIDTAAAAHPDGDTCSWNWRGKGWLWLIRSHWEILGWGEREVVHGTGEKERWVVTWFEATLFTKEGVDIYCDRREGVSKELAEEILRALKEGLEAPELAALCARDMKEVEISLPWAEK